MKVLTMGSIQLHNTPNLMVRCESTRIAFPALSRSATMVLHHCCSASKAGTCDVASIKYEFAKGQGGDPTISDSCGGKMF